LNKRKAESSNGSSGPDVTGLKGNSRHWFRSEVVHRNSASAPAALIAFGNQVEAKPSIHVNDHFGSDIIH